MTIFLTTIHILACLILIAVVLLQSGKGAEMGASFGSSGSQSVFGAGGGTSFLSKITAIAAVVFMLGSLALAYVSGLPSSSSIMSDKSSPATVDKAPAQTVPAGQSPLTPAPAQGKPATAPAVPVPAQK